jgi:hypothetical protein
LLAQDWLRVVNSRYSNDLRNAFYPLVLHATSQNGCNKIIVVLLRARLFAALSCALHQWLARINSINLRPMPFAQPGLKS